LNAEIHVPMLLSTLYGRTGLLVSAPKLNNCVTMGAEMLFATFTFATPAAAPSPAAPAAAPSDEFTLPAAARPAERDRVDILNEVKVESYQPLVVEVRACTD
jgi:hypothetical protein